MWEQHKNLIFGGFEKGERDEENYGSVYGTEEPVPAV